MAITSVDELYNGTDILRVYNTCKYDIGMPTIDGRGLLVKAGGFNMASVNDILHAHTVSTKHKFFLTKKLIIKDMRGNDVPLEKVGIFEAAAPEEVHNTDNDITAMLKQNAKKIEEWIKNIEDPAELYHIYVVAKEADLSASKLSVLNKYIKDKEWFEEESAE